MLKKIGIKTCRRIQILNGHFRKTQACEKVALYAFTSAFKIQIPIIMIASNNYVTELQRERVI